MGWQSDCHLKIVRFLAESLVGQFRSFITYGSYFPLAHTHDWWCRQGDVWNSAVTSGFDCTLHTFRNNVMLVSEWVAFFSSWSIERVSLVTDLNIHLHLVLKFKHQWGYASAATCAHTDFLDHTKYQRDALNIIYSSNILLYMFWVSSTHLQEEQLYVSSIWYRHSL